MILGALLLVLIGLADLIRASPRLSRRVWIPTVIVTWAALLLLAVTGLGVHPVWASIPVVLATVWVITTSSQPVIPSRSGVLPAIGLVVALVVAVAAGGSSDALHGYLVVWHATSGVSGVPLLALVMGVGCAVFLVESANIVVRAALSPSLADLPVTPARPAQSPPAPAPTPTRERWWQRRSSVTPVSPLTDLKGGRLIGPLERLMIAALTLVGALPIAAGLIAAKGIVRFPEISQDAKTGSKAEYFLVGSLVSWAIGLGAAGLLWISAR